MFSYYTGHAYLACAMVNCQDNFPYQSIFQFGLSGHCERSASRIVQKYIAISESNFLLIRTRHNKCWWSSASILYYFLQAWCFCRSHPFTVRYIYNSSLKWLNWLSNSSVLVLLRAWALWGDRHKIAKALVALFVIYVAICTSLFTYGIIIRGCEFLIASRPTGLHSFTLFVADDAYVMPDIVGTCISFIPSLFFEVFDFYLGCWLVHTWQIGG
jgi:hypothetical protein